MNKELLKELQVQAGGSHYPDINPQMQEAFARLIIDQCISAVRDTSMTHCLTTFDMGLAESTVERSVKSIEERFEYNAVPPTRKPNKIAPVGGSWI